MEGEKSSVRSDIEKLQDKLDATKEKQLQAEAKVTELTEKLTVAEQSTAATTQQLASQSANVEAYSKSKVSIH